MSKNRFTEYPIIAMLVLLLIINKLTTQRVINEPEHGFQPSNKLRSGP